MKDPGAVGMNPTQTLCKPVGGGVFDIENVTPAQAQPYLAAGYYNCGDGNSAFTGYCVVDPHNAPTYQDCQPAPSPVASVVATPAPTVTLPDTGASTGFYVVLALVAIMVGVLVHWRQKR